MSDVLPPLLSLATPRVLAHMLFEAAAYALGFSLFLKARQQFGDVVDHSARWSVITGAFLGAVVGAHVLAWFEHPALLLRGWPDARLVFGSKTVLGGLIGGIAGVELTKVGLGIRQSTGDLFAVALCVGIAVGRIGCAIAGPGDHTWGSATTLVFGIDGGDGVRRHCLPLYEALILVPFAVVLWKLQSRPRRDGDLFRLFMVAYAILRFALETLKDGPRVGPLTAIQWSCAAVLAYYARHLLRLGIWTARRNEAVA